MKRRWLLSIVVAFLFVAIVAALLPSRGIVAQNDNGITVLISRNSNGTQGDGASSFSAIAANGCCIVFSSRARNLVNEDANGFGLDVFLFNVSTGDVELISKNSDGVSGNGHSSGATISDDGRYIAFQSGSSNLVENDNNGFDDIFVHDRQTGITTRVSIAFDGTDANENSAVPNISGDGRYVAFVSSADNLVVGEATDSSKVFVYSLETKQTFLVDRNTAGTIANNASTELDISSDGRFITFRSLATNLVANDTNSWADIFIHDLLTGETVLASRRSNGALANRHSYRPTISGDGRYVAFLSIASNLVSGDTNDAMDVFLYDRQLVTTTRVPRSTGASEVSISPDGQFIVFTSADNELVSNDSNGSSDIFVYDRLAGRTTLVSLHTDGTQGNEHSQGGSISAGGELVTFVSGATNLVDDDLNGLADNFLRDLDSQNAPITISGRVTSPENETSVSGATVLLNNTFPTQTDSTGQYVFNDVVPGQYSITVLNYNTIPEAHVVSVPPDATHQDFVGTPVLSSIIGSVNHAITNEPIAGAYIFVDNTILDVSDANGSYSVSGLAAGTYQLMASKLGLGFSPASQTITVPPSINGVDFSGQSIDDSYPGITTRVSIASDGTQGNEASYFPSVSGDGRTVAFYSSADNLVPGDTNNREDVFVHDRSTGSTIRIAGAFDGLEANGGGDYPSISTDGRFVAFLSDATNLVGDDTNSTWDVFVHDLQMGETTRVSVASDGTEGNSESSGIPSISDDGRFIAFSSSASNLVDQDSNGFADIFVHDQLTEDTERVSVASNGTESNGWTAQDVDISGDGRYVTYVSGATNLVIDDTNNVRDIFVHDRETGETTRVSVSSDGIEGNSHSYYPSISADGNVIVFESDADNLVSECSTQPSNIFVHDRLTHTTTCVSTALDGTEANDWSGLHFSNSSVSGEGRYIVFSSMASNLIDGDTNENQDVFVHDRQTDTTFRVSLSSGGFQGNQTSHVASITADGLYVAFESFATNLAGQDTNDNSDVFVREIATPSKDDDGIDDDTENGAPNNGDGNNDGIPDSQQDNVTSLPDSATAAYVTLASPDGTALLGVTATNNPAPGTEPSGAEFPVGFIEFAIGGLGYGAATTVEVFLESGVTAETYYKYGPTVDNPAAHWYEFHYDGATGAEILADKIVLHFVDGQRGDGDLTADGVIDDPGAPAVVTPPTPPAIFLSPAGAGNLGGKAFTGADILSYVKATDTWDVLYDGSAANTPKNVGTFAFDGDGILLGFSANQPVPGLGTFAAHDLALFTPTSLGYNTTAGSFAWFFDGSDVGLSTTAEKLDALWIDADGRLYVSTTGSGAVPVDSAVPTGAKLKFQDEDILRFTPRSTGATTSGTWALYWNPTAVTGMSAEDINGYWEDPATGDRYVTILGGFTVGNAAYGARLTGNGKSILRFAPNAAAPGGWAPAELVPWLAAGAALPSTFAIDGIEMGR